MQVWWAYRANPVTSAEDPGTSSPARSAASAGAAGARQPARASARGTFAGARRCSEANRATVPPAGGRPARSRWAPSATARRSPARANRGDALASCARGACSSRSAITARRRSPSSRRCRRRSRVPASRSTISATDAGSGVHTARLLVDGTPVGAPVVVDAAGGACAPATRTAASTPRAMPGIGHAARPSRSTQHGRQRPAPAVAVRVADAAGNVADSRRRP